MSYSIDLRNNDGFSSPDPDHWFTQKSPRAQLSASKEAEARERRALANRNDTNFLGSLGKSTRPRFVRERPHTGVRLPVGNAAWHRHENLAARYENGTQPSRTSPLRARRRGPGGVCSSDTPRNTSCMRARGIHMRHHHRYKKTHRNKKTKGRGRKKTRHRNKTKGHKKRMSLRGKKTHKRK
jgi:hypothetical protein